MKHMQEVIDAHEHVKTLNIALNDMGDTAETIRNVFGTSRDNALWIAAELVGKIYDVDLSDYWEPLFDDE